MLMHHDVATPLPFDTASFDGVVCMQVAYTLPDPDALLREIRRVLTSSGRFILVNPHNADRRAIMRAHYANVWSGDRPPSFFREARIVTAFAALYALNGYIVRRAGDRRYHFLSPDVLTQKVVNAGFTIREQHASVYGGTSVLLYAQCR
jgi:ubiquinone/menaquinone biosynthesis C-methylase UbiE